MAGFHRGAEMPAGISDFEAAQQRWLDSQPTWPTLASLADQRVAVCLVGATRTLTQPGVYRSIKKNLLDAQLVPADLFVHLHLAWDSTKFAAGMGHHGTAGASIRASDRKLQAALDHLKPLAVDIASSSGCDNSVMAALPVCQQVNQRRVGGIERRTRHGMNASYMPVNLNKLPTDGELAGYLQFMWVHRCLLRVVAHEKSVLGHEYAWVIRTRPDLAFFDRVPAAIAMPTRRAVLMEKESNPAFFDGFWMVPRRLLPAFADGIDEFWHTCPSLPWPPEWSFFPWVRDRKRLAWGYALIPAVLVRGPGIADCWRLATKETPQFVYELQGSAWGRAPLEVRARAHGGESADEDKRRGAEALVQDEGPLVNFAGACEQFFGRRPYSRRHDMIRRDPPAHREADPPTHREAGAPASDFRSHHSRFSAYLKPILLPSFRFWKGKVALPEVMPPPKPERCELESEWSTAPGNVPTPLDVTDRCNVRFETFEAAARACCANPRCDAVVKDTGIICLAGGNPPTHAPARGPKKSVAKGKKLLYELRHGLTPTQMGLVRRLAPPGEGAGPPAAMDVTTTAAAAVSAHEDREEMERTAREQMLSPSGRAQEMPHRRQQQRAQARAVRTEGGDAPAAALNAIGAGVLDDLLRVKAKEEARAARAAEAAKDAFGGELKEARAMGAAEEEAANAQADG